MTPDTLLSLEHLKMYFPVVQGLLRRKIGDIKAVDDVSFTIAKNETLGLVGESGCGKTTIGRCILRLYRPTGGQILFQGNDISQLSEGQLRRFRCRIGTIFQDPYGSLNPRQSARTIAAASLRIHHRLRRREQQEKVAELFRLVGLDPSLMDRVPHEFSGGQRQRLGIARALATSPALVVCDEPISALDVSIQAQIINLLDSLQEKLGLTYLFIAHDLSMVQHISDRVAVMYLGRIVESAEAMELFRHPLHPYTRALLASVPIPDPKLERSRERMVLKGEVPSLMHPPLGCHFHPRCDRATIDCRSLRPSLRRVGQAHEVACYHA